MILSLSPHPPTYSNCVFRPLEISKVSEIKSVNISYLSSIWLTRNTRALLPDLIKFSYISPAELEDQIDAKSHSGGSSVDYSLTTTSQKGYVLVVDFQDDAKGRKNVIATQQVNSPLSS